MTDLTARRLKTLGRLRTDFPHYAEQCLRIKSKGGEIVPLRLNKAQAYVHERIEAQRQRTGKVRVLLLKARQQGFSTYIAGRFYWKTSLNRGLQTFILTHEQDATDNLFGMVERYHKHSPLKPSTGAANAKEMYFNVLDSGYSVGTAGSKAVGRSKTTQLFHGSEVAFWPNAATHFAGAVQTVPDLPGTEIVLESTANGMGGEFHERWQQAEAGVGDYEAVFVPWFWADEYKRTVPDGFVADDDELKEMELHGLSLEQVVWRRAKIAELKDILLFKQEYPATAAEAFQTTGHDSFIKAEHVLAARKNTVEGVGPLICGADPARFGDDRFSVAWRRGRKVSKIESRSKLDTVAGANWLRKIIDEDKPKKMFVDVGGIGGGTIDILHSWGEPYKSVVVAVNFGSAPYDPSPKDKDGKPSAGPLNRRSEMWSHSNDWLKDVAGVDLPDIDGLQADACGPSYKYDMKQRLQLESKEAMRARGIRSPDEWDAVALTFAEPVSSEDASWAQPDTGWIV